MTLILYLFTYLFLSQSQMLWKYQFILDDSEKSDSIEQEHNTENTNSSSQTVQRSQALSVLCLSHMHNLFKLDGIKEAYTHIGI